MSLARLESDLLKVKKGLGEVKRVNTDFEKVIQELSFLKQRASVDEQTKNNITEELKSKEIIDLFDGIQKDFDELRTQLSKQNLEKERLTDFMESLRTKKSFSFDESTKTIIFLGEIFDALQPQYISIKPQYMGTIDLGGIAIELGLHKTGSAVLVEKESFSEALTLMISRKMFRNIIFETDNTKVILKSSNEVVVESDNYHLKKIIRLSKQE